MRRITFLGLLVVLFCSGILRAEVYTIDFNRGTVHGDDIETGIGESTNTGDVCETGSEYFIFRTVSKCYYDNKGCGIKIANNAATGIFTISLIEKKKVSKIVIYASREATNTKSAMDVYVLNTVIRTFPNKELCAYSTDNAASTFYQLPDIVINKEFKDLKFQVSSKCMVVLHRIDIYTADEASLTLPAQSGGTHYATFSNNKATFFPTDASVSKVLVRNGHLSVTNLESQVGFGTRGCYVPANTGVLVASTSSSTSYYVLDGETLDALTDNMLKPASEPMTGDNKFYKLAYDDYDNKTGLGFYWGAAGGAAFPCKEGAAYLAVPNNGSSVKGFVLDEASDEDAIKSLTPDFSQGRGEIFYMTGQRISKPLQGIYIKGGRKYVGK